MARKRMREIRIIREHFRNDMGLGCDSAGWAKCRIA